MYTVQSFCHTIMSSYRRLTAIFSERDYEYTTAHCSHINTQHRSDLGCEYYWTTIIILFRRKEEFYLNLKEKCVMKSSSLHFLNYEIYFSLVIKLKTERKY